MKITPYNNHEGFSCPVTLGPQPENTGSAEAFVLIQSNNACQIMLVTCAGVILIWGGF
jgi:hypothetical protein